MRLALADGIHQLGSLGAGQAQITRYRASDSGDNCTLGLLTSQSLHIVSYLERTEGEAEDLRCP